MYHKLTFCLTTDFLMELRNSYHLPDVAAILRVWCGNTTAVFVVTPVWPSLLQHQPDKTVPQLQRGHKAPIVLTMTAPRLCIYHTVFAIRACHFRPPAAYAAYDDCISWPHNFILCSSQSHLALFTRPLEQQVLYRPPTPTHPWCVGH